MLLTLIFSRDRALQLQASLDSFMLQARDASLAQIVVLYRASTVRHQSQYDQLARKYRRQALFIAESAFRAQVLEILSSLLKADPMERGRRNRFGWSRTGRRNEVQPAPQVLFLVDDSLFIRSFRLHDAVESLGSNADAIGFSLRLGRNTTRCYVLDRPQALPEFEILSKTTLKYDWRRADADFGYPLELSSSLYRLESILRMADGLNFGDPNTLESQMAGEARRIGHRQPALLCYEQSVAFSAPINRVQEVYKNKAGAGADLSTERLADLFEQGKRISLRHLEGFEPSACHQEVELTFELAEP